MLLGPRQRQDDTAQCKQPQNEWQMPENIFERRNRKRMSCRHLQGALPPIVLFDVPPYQHGKNYKKTKQFWVSELDMSKPVVKHPCLRLFLFVFLNFYFFNIINEVFYCIK